MTSAPLLAPTGIAAEARRIGALAWPVVFTSLNWTLLQVTDVIVVGLTGTTEVAALGASRALTFIGIVVAFGAVTGVLVFASRADGAGDLPATGKTFREGIVLATLLGLASGLALFAFAEPALLALGVAPEVAPGAAAVVRVMAISYPFQLILIAASLFLEGVSSPRRVMVVNLAMLPFNAVLAWALSGGHLGLPALGAVGAAAATAIACAFGAAAMVGAALTLPDAAARQMRDWRGIASLETVRGAGRLLGFGAMPALASGLELAGFSILIALSTRFGETATHAFQIVFSVHNVTFAVALGLGSAAGVRAGNAVGEGIPGAARGRTTIAAGIAALATGVLSLGLLVFPGPVTEVFPATDAVHLMAAAMLWVWAPFIVFDGIQVVFVYALRSLGDQVMTGVNSILSYFLVTGGVGLWLVHIGWGPMALVWASAIGMVAAATLHGARFYWVTRRSSPRS